LIVDNANIEKGTRELLVERVLKNITEEVDVILVAEAGSQLANFFEQHGIKKNDKYKFYSGKFRL